MFFFFCKQKTAYELRISDWSSDVCSSDLPQSRLHRLVPLSGLDREGVIRLELDVPALHGAREHVRRRSRPQQGVPHPDLSDTEFREDTEGRRALRFGVGESLNESGQSFGRRRTPLRREVVRGHARNLREHLDAGTALIYGGRDVDHDLRHRGTAGLSLDTNRRQRRGKTENITLSEPDLLASTSETQRHLEDLGFRRGVVVTKPDDRGTQVRYLVLRCDRKSTRLNSSH